MKTRPVSFGLWPKKGAIELGADADLVLWDPSGTTLVTRAKLHTRAGYSLYEGRKLRGKHVATLVGGRALSRAGDVVDDRAAGKLLPTMHGDLRRGDPPRMIDDSWSAETLPEA